MEAVLTARDQPVPCRLLPALSRWADLDQREDAAGIGPGHPILIDPEYRLDPLLARFLNRSRFAWLAEGTRQAYAKDYRLFFSFLWQRGRYWQEADPDDLLDWGAWRRRGQQPGQGIGGGKWQRDLAALRLVYEWAEKEQHIVRSPVLVHQVRLRGGGTATVADEVPRDVRSADVKWVTPRIYRLWRDTGLLGYDADSQPDPSWRGRNDGRNAAFADLLFSCGCGRAAACSPLRCLTWPAGTGTARAPSRARSPSGGSECSTPRPPRWAVLPATWPPPGRTRSAAPGGTAATSRSRGGWSSPG